MYTCVLLRDGQHVHCPLKRIKVGHWSVEPLIRWAVDQRTNGLDMLWTINGHRVTFIQLLTFLHTKRFYERMSLSSVDNRVQWFWLFFTFWGITTHPWHPKGPRIWKLAKKNFQLHPWPAEIFSKNRKMRFLGLVSKFNFRSPVWQIFTIFSGCFIYGILNTHIKF